MMKTTSMTIYSDKKWRFRRWVRDNLLSSALMHGAIVSVLVGGLVGVSPTAMAHTIETDQSKFQRVDQPIALKVGVAATGLGLIAIELWWFLSSRTKAQTNQKTEEGHQSVQSKNGL